MSNPNPKQAVKPQITVSKNQKSVFEVLDSLHVNRKYSKIKLNAVDFSKKATGGQSVLVSHNMNTDVAKVVFSDIFNGSFKSYEEYKGFPTNRPDGKPEAHTLKIAYNPTRPDGQASNYPYTITIACGEGATIGQGAVKMVKVEKTVTINLSVADARRMAKATLDWISTWETHNFKAMVTEYSKPYDGEVDEETA